MAGVPTQYRNKVLSHHRSWTHTEVAPNSRRHIGTAPKVGISIEQNRCHSDGCSSRSPVYSCQQSAWQAPGLPEYLTASYSCSLSGCSSNTHVVLTSSRKHPRHSRGDYSSSHVTGLTVVHDVSRKTTETRKNCRHPPVSVCV